MRAGRGAPATEKPGRTEKTTQCVGEPYGDRAESERTGCCCGRLRPSEVQRLNGSGLPRRGPWLRSGRRNNRRVRGEVARGAATNALALLCGLIPYRDSMYLDWRCIHLTVQAGFRHGSQSERSRPPAGLTPDPRMQRARCSSIWSSRAALELTGSTTRLVGTGSRPLVERLTRATPRRLHRWSSLAFQRGTSTRSRCRRRPSMARPRAKARRRFR